MEVEVTEEEINAEPMPPRILLVDTMDSDLFSQFKGLFRFYGFELKDVNSDEFIHNTQFPRLIYRRTTAASVNAVRALLNRSITQYPPTCALLDKKEGLEYLENVDKERYRLNLICSAAIYDDLFRQIRTWLRHGYRDIDIQQDLEKHFEEIIDLKKICVDQGVCAYPGPRGQKSHSKSTSQS
eukprot:Clim_evm51s229 gene=Clim_evmTU51s229